MTRTRRDHRASIKEKVALAAANRDKTLLELTQGIRVHLPTITEWKQPLPTRTADVCSGALPTADRPGRKILHTTSGPLARGYDLFECPLHYPNSGLSSTT